MTSHTKLIDAVHTILSKISRRWQNRRIAVQIDDASRAVAIPRDIPISSDVTVPNHVPVSGGVPIASHVPVSGGVSITHYVTVARGITVPGVPVPRDVISITVAVSR